MIARVQPLTTTRAIRGPFDYRLRPEQADVELGALLRVPFANRRALGVVVDLAGESELPLERLLEPDMVLPAGVPRDLVALAAWMAREYCSTMARCLSLMLAPGATGGVLAAEALVAEVTDAGRRLLAGAGNGALSSGAGNGALSSGAGNGARSSGAGADSPATNGARPLTARQLELLGRLQHHGPTIAASLGTPALRRLERRGLVEIVSGKRERRPVRHSVGAGLGAAPALNAEQQEALERILEALEGAGDRRGFLLHGVTGSGKTEVYLRAVEATLEAGASAIVLVPEIALTPQTRARFQARFGDVVAVLHSALGQGERYDEWLRLRDGEARVCVGPRSAVFAPLKDIGLIVIDEEHDRSYKHESDPRYDARTVAARRAQDHGAILVAGSATPRPESTVSLNRLRLSQRVDRRPLPPVELLDMRGSHHPLHPETRLALADVRRARGKAIVLLNRRGWSNFLTCRACGQVWMCPDCDVALVLHRSSASTPAYVACHHCGHRERVPERCTSCRSVAVARHGAGTERLEHELRLAIGDSGFPVFRLDADVAAGKDRVARELTAFEAAPAGVLVGTQMVAKGHDFPDVTLGVVLDADQTLRFPDFRAEERTFALITQLAGRAGRGDRGGRVLVQTMAPSARAIVFAARHDADGFLADELRRRTALRYPPAGSLIRITCSAAELAAALSETRSVRDQILCPSATVLGPAPLFRLRGKARAQLVIKTTDRQAAIRAVGAAVDRVGAGAAQRGVSVSVDVDPQ
ncbi:MAG: primosomal protein N' [Solirubrobacterales bacterium]|nr:primosomal protein N' [Solirubrobacterales bacterium]